MWLSPRYSRSMSPRRQTCPSVVSGSGSEDCPANRLRPSGRSGSTARASSSLARSTRSGSGPRIRSSWASAPSVRAWQIVAASVLVQPNVTAGTTTSGLNTPNVAATTVPGTWPSTLPRLVK
jgi:hypothetical protein